MAKASPTIQFWDADSRVDSERPTIAMTDQPTVDEVAQLRQRYRDLVIDRAQSHDPTTANRIFRQHHKFYKEIRTTAAGRQAITDLLYDVLDPVRLLAATQRGLEAGRGNVGLARAAGRRKSVCDRCRVHTEGDSRRITEPRLVSTMLGRSRQQR